LPQAGYLLFTESPRRDVLGNSGAREHKKRAGATSTKALS